MLSKYDAMLSRTRQCDDYWYDVAMSDAVDFLQHFSEEDWAGMKKLLNERPTLWQISCAETLSESTDKERSLDLLTMLMMVGNGDVMVAALDSINALASYGLDITGKSEQLRSAIAKARANSGAAVSRMLTALEEKLPPA
jgi:hypothetical protein